MDVPASCIRNETPGRAAAVCWPANVSEYAGWLSEGGGGASHCWSALQES